MRTDLIDNKCLPPELIDLLYNKGWIDTDSQGRAVFALRTLAGGWKGICILESNGKFSIGADMEKRTQDDDTNKGVFWVAIQTNIQRAILTSDPVETLSAIALDPDFERRPTLCLE